MKIAIFTLGTRGDVQPYAVLGKALKKRGHEVVLSTAKNFKELIESYGLSFVPVNADFQALLESDDLKKIRKNPFMAKKMLAKFVYPMLDDALSTFYELAGDADRVLFHIKTMSDNFADQFPDRMIKTDVIPASQPTYAFPNPVFSFLPLPKYLNRLSFKVTELGLRMWDKPVKDFRLKAGLPVNFKKPHLRTLYGISEHLLPKPGDYPADSYFAGFWTDISGSELPVDLVEFIKNGEPPLLITFGSMPFDTTMDLSSLFSSLVSNLGIRLVVVRGWGLKNISGGEWGDSVKLIDSAPYDKLIPLVKAVVHHGGIGTMAACLNAGKPMMTCPVLYPMGDQYFWGSVAYQQGVALKPKPLKKLTVDRFVAAVKELITDDQLYVKAGEMALKLRSENGVMNAIQFIEADS